MFDPTFKQKVIAHILLFVGYVVTTAAFIGLHSFISNDLFHKIVCALYVGANIYFAYRFVRYLIIGK